jgi:hypothetical protein
MHERGHGGEAGFGLLEVMMAAGLLVTVAVGASQVIAAATRVTFSARVRTMGTVLAAQKMEQLRSLAFGHALAGTPPVSIPSGDTSTDLATEPPTDAGPGLQPSPAGSLAANTPFYVDYLDASGKWAGTGSSIPQGAVYTRRWAVQPLPADPENVLVLQVLVTTAWGDGSRFVTLKARRP